MDKLDIEDVIQSTRKNISPALADEMEYLWDHPEEFEEAETLNMDDPPVDKDYYVFFRLGVVFGIEYENEYPQDGDWREE